MGRLALVLLLGTGLLQADEDPDYVLAQAKLEAIADEAIPRGSTVTLTPTEVNAYARGEAAEALGEGLKDIDIRLGNDSLDASGLINPSELPGLGALGSGWLLGGLLQGEKPFEVRARVTSGSGIAAVYVESVSVASQELDDRSRNFLLGWILRPLVGDAVLGEPVELENNVESIRIRPSGIEIKIAD